MGKLSQHTVIRIIYIVLLLGVFGVFVFPFLIPIVFAGTVSLALFPLLLKFESFGLERRRAAGLLTILFTIVISIPLFFFIVRGTNLITNHLEKIEFNEKLKDTGVQGFVSDLRHDVVLTVHKYTSKFEVTDFLTPNKIDKYLNSVSSFLLTFFQGFAISLPVIFLFLLVMVLCVFSFLKHSHNIRQFFQNIFGFNDNLMDELVAIFISDSRQVYISNLATGGIQSLIVAITATIFNIGSFFLIFFITFILSFIPVIGAAPVAFICAFLAFIQDQNTAAIVLFVVGCFTGVVDNILRPWLTSFGESSIPPMVSFICVLGGALILGFPGLFIGILVGSIVYDTIPIFWRELGKNKE